MRALERPKSMYYDALQTSWNVTSRGNLVLSWRVPATFLTQLAQQSIEFSLSFSNASLKHHDSREEPRRMCFDTRSVVEQNAASLHVRAEGMKCSKRLEPAESSSNASTRSPRYKSVRIASNVFFTGPAQLQACPRTPRTNGVIRQIPLTPNQW